MINLKLLILCLLLIFIEIKDIQAQKLSTIVPEKTMKSIYEEIKTPYKYGLIMVPENNSKKVDCPTVFRKNNHWYMTYLIYDGRGYETWLAKSNDLLNWTTQGRIMSFSDTADWDNNQKGGYIALLDYQWGGSYEPRTYQGKYWLSYFGGPTRGYEAGLLSVGIAFTSGDITNPHEWQRLKRPVLMATDKDVRWWENNTIYKNSVIWDKAQTTGHPFVMYYNAKGDSINPKPRTERIGMAVSDDMEHWIRYRKNPVLLRDTRITGDAVIQKIGKVWVMFYFGAFGKNKPGAFNRFACSYDLVNWTDWTGDDLIIPSESYDQLYAHKSFVVKYKGVVYHFYCAVNKAEQRGIAVATSKDLGKGTLQFSKE